jgi:hypothetical protein
MVANLDVKSFFPSTDINAVLQALLRLGIPKDPAGLLAVLMTCPDEKGIKALPQGAPTSPYIANHVLSPVDQRFATFCKGRGLGYTRYIDDIAVSGDRDFRQFKGTFVQFIRDAGYEVALNKIVFCGRDRPQIVTGLTVNDKLRPVLSFVRELAMLIKNCYWPDGPGLEVMAAAEGLRVQELKERIVGRIQHVRRFDPKGACRLTALKFKRTRPRLH